MIIKIIDYDDIFLGPVWMCPELGFVWKYKRVPFGAA